MITKPLLDNVIRELCALFPDERLAGNTKEQIRSILKRGIESLDLVSREEFDAQVGVLQRTEARLQSLETQLQQSTPTQAACSEPTTAEQTNPGATHNHPTDIDAITIAEATPSDPSSPPSTDQDSKP